VKRLVTGRLPALRLKALREGVFGGNSRWLALWGVLVTARLVKRLAADKPVVERFVLGPGQALLITDLASDQQPAPS
jgi:hypothetical protein